MGAALTAHSLDEGRDARAYATLIASRFGYWALLALAVALPFEITQDPIVSAPALTLTNLKVIYYLVAILAIASLAGSDLRRRVGVARPQVGLLAALVLVSAMSALISGHRSDGLKWTLDLAVGGLLWLAIPVWFDNRLESTNGPRLPALATALVVGGVISALVGLCEVIIGPSFAGGLPWFKVKPTMIGPYLRLSGTFEYANIAAGYFALVLPFAAAGAVTSWARSRAAFLAWSSGGLILLVALLLTYSRGAEFATIVGLAAMALTLHRTLLTTSTFRRVRWPAVVVAGGGLLAGAMVLMLSGPGLLRLSTQSDIDWYRATYSSPLPHTIRAGAVLTVPVTVHNLGPVTWRSHGTTPYKLSYHWLLPSGRVLTYDGLRTSLPHSVLPNELLTVRARLMAPPHAGRYQLVWDMVLEHVTWFSVKTGTYRSIGVSVSGPARQSRPAAGANSEPSTLPSNPAQPNRGTLWAVALRMIRAHPLLGVGPDGYRLTYGRYTVPPEQSWDTRIFANSFPLEIGSDLGVIGAALFLAFLMAVMRPFISITRNRQSIGVWEAALLGALAAFFAHGLVDYLLGAHAIFILFWILLALAAAASGWRPLTDAVLSAEC